jgi:hypothetical protein
MTVRTVVVFISRSKHTQGQQTLPYIRSGLFPFTFDATPFELLTLREIRYK